ncbi:hypothetical protein, partial [Adlercreutzia equolifaciens]|uniref:hypothetical protein n=1 Tax=Adlercreutzia equolifaciens TaxID=446660 RepID=UPI0026741474
PFRVYRKWVYVNGGLTAGELKWRKIFELLEFRRQQPHPLRYLIFHITSLTWGYSPCSDALMNVMATYLGIAPNKSLTTRNCRPRIWQRLAGARPPEAK